MTDAEVAELVGWPHWRRFGKEKPIPVVHFKGLSTSGRACKPWRPTTDANHAIQAAKRIFRGWTLDQCRNAVTFEGIRHNDGKTFVVNRSLHQECAAICAAIAAAGPKEQGDG